MSNKSTHIFIYYNTPYYIMNPTTYNIIIQEHPNKIILTANNILQAESIYPTETTPTSIMAFLRSAMHDLILPIYTPVIINTNYNPFYTYLITHDNFLYSKFHNLDINEDPLITTQPIIRNAIYDIQFYDLPINSYIIVQIPQTHERFPYTTIVLSSLIKYPHQIHKLTNPILDIPTLMIGLINMYPNLSHYTLFPIQLSLIPQIYLIHISDPKT